MAGFDALPLESEIVVSIGAPKYDRRLSDKILAAFTFAYGEGAWGVAAVLRRALEEAERGPDGRLAERRAGSALAQADLWIDFVEARDAFRRLDQAQATDPAALERARVDMIVAHRRWGQN